MELISLDTLELESFQKRNLFRGLMELELKITMKKDDQDQHALQDIAVEWRKISEKASRREDLESELFHKFNKAIKRETGPRVNEFWNLLSPCLSPTPEDRPSMADIVAKLEGFRPDLREPTCATSPEA